MLLRSFWFGLDAMECTCGWVIVHIDAYYPPKCCEQLTALIGDVVYVDFQCPRLIHSFQRNCEETEHESQN